MSRYTVVYNAVVVPPFIDHGIGWSDRIGWFVGIEKWAERLSSVVKTPNIWRPVKET
jgi:hypothetical protein